MTKTQLDVRCMETLSMLHSGDGGSFWLISSFDHSGNMEAYSSFITLINLSLSHTANKSTNRITEKMMTYGDVVFWFSEVSDSNNLWLKAVDSESIAIIFWLYSGLSEEKAPMGATFACLGMKDRWCWKEIFDKTVMWYDATCWTALQAKALDLYFCGANSWQEIFRVQDFKLKAEGNEDLVCVLEALLVYWLVECAWACVCLLYAVTLLWLHLPLLLSFSSCGSAGRAVDSSRWQFKSLVPPLHIALSKTFSRPSSSAGKTCTLAHVYEGEENCSAFHLARLKHY